MKTYEIRYYFDNDNYIPRVIHEIDTLEVNTVLEKYTKGDYQIFPHGDGVLTRVNMNKVIYVNIWEVK